MMQSLASALPSHLNAILDSHFLASATTVRTENKTLQISMVWAVRRYQERFDWKVWNLMVKSVGISCTMTAIHQPFSFAFHCIRWSKAMFGEIVDAFRMRVNFSRVHRNCGHLIVRIVSSPFWLSSFRRPSSDPIPFECVNFNCDLM